MHSCITDMLLRWNIIFHHSSLVELKKNLKPFSRGSRSPWQACLRQRSREHKLQSHVSKNFTLLHPPNSRGRPAIFYSLDLNSRDYAEFSLLLSLFPLSFYSQEYFVSRSLVQFLWHSHIHHYSKPMCLVWLFPSWGRPGSVRRS